MNTSSISDTSGTFVENEQKTEHDNISEVVNNECNITDNQNAADDLSQVSETLSKKGKLGDGSESSDHEPVNFHSAKRPKVEEPEERELTGKNSTPRTQKRPKLQDISKIPEVHNDVRQEEGNVGMGMPFKSE